MQKLKESILIVLICITVLTLNACVNDKIRTYTDKNYNFSVEFPKNWSSKVQETWEATATREASPDGGIDIYVEGNKENMISVIGQNGHLGISLPGYEDSEFITKSGLKGVLYSQTNSKRKEMYLIFDEGFHYVHAIVSLDCYIRNEKKIINVFKSINIISTTE